MEIFQIIEEGTADELENWLKLQKNIKEVLETTDERGKTPLIAALASIKKSMRKIKLLIKYGADVHAIDRTNNTTLMWAGTIPNKFERKELVEILLEKGVDVKAVNEYGNSILSILTLRGEEEELVIKAIEKGAYVDCNDLSVILSYITNAAMRLTIEYVVEHGCFLKEENRKKLKGMRLDNLF
jgi:ankyrin repeat protein